MIIYNLFREATISIGMNRLRTFLAVLGIVIGVGSVVLMIAIGTGSKKSIEEKIEKLGTNMLILSYSYSSSRFENPWGYLSIQDINAVAQLPSVLAASPVNTVNENTIAIGNLTWKARISGVYPEYFTVRTWPLDIGNNFSEEEMQQAKRVVILGKTIADKLFPGQDPLYQIVRINNMPFLIIGVLSSKGQGFDGRDNDDIAFIPYSTLKTKFTTPNSLTRYDSVDLAFIKSLSAKHLQTTVDEISVLLRKRHKLRDTQEDTFRIQNITALTKVAADTSQALSILLSAIASISLIVGGIGIMNMMLVTVTERTREIGIRKAIGASKKMILFQFLLEAIIISMIGSLFGLAAGLGLSALAEKWLNIPVAYTLWSAITAFLVAIVIGIISGYYPARRAEKMQPVEALRSANA